MSKKIIYSYRKNDVKTGELLFTEDKSLKEEHPNTFGISKSAMRDKGCLVKEQVKKDTKSKVIIIGNSTEVLKKEYGSIIDSYDIVIRVNHCVTKEHEKYVGTKTDIWATTHLHYHRNSDGSLFLPQDSKNIKEIWKRTEKVKVKTKNGGKNSLKKEKYEKYFSRDVKTKIMYKEFGKGRSTQKDRNLLEKYGVELSKLKKEPDTGFLTILTALELFNDITVHGFTFYTESKDPTAYYRDKQQDDNGKHKEDIYWKRVAKSGFTSKELGYYKLQILKNLDLKVLDKINGENK